VAVLWAAIVGPSGTLKSPAMNLALGSLKRLQAWAMAEYPALCEQFARDNALFEADYQAWKKDGRKKGEPPPERPDEPQPRRYLCDDITPEALADRLLYNPRGLGCCPDELAAWLGSFGQYKNGGKSGDVARWLSIYRAESLLIDRKTGPVKTLFVQRAAVSVVGGIQPKTLKRALGDEYMDNGLAARLLVVMPPPIAKHWTESVVGFDLQKSVDRVFGRLLALDFVQMDEGPAPRDIPLTADGKRAWIRFYDEHAREQSRLTGNLAAAASKLEGSCGRFALVLHLARWAADDPTATLDGIDAESVNAGVRLVEWFGNEVQRVYATFTESDADRDRWQLAELIRLQGGEISARDLQRARHRQLPTAEHAEKLLAELVEHGFGTLTPCPPGPTGGRPTSVFRLTELVTGDTTPLIPEKSGGFVTGGGVDEANRLLYEAAEDNTYGEVA
jgi:hypothetical protein